MLLLMIFIIACFFVSPFRFTFFPLKNVAIPANTKTIPALQKTFTIIMVPPLKNKNVLCFLSHHKVRP